LCKALEGIVVQPNQFWIDNNTGMRMKLLHVSLFLLLILASCIPSNVTETDKSDISVSVVPTNSKTEAVTATPVITETLQSKSNEIVVWIAEKFSNKENKAGEMLEERIQLFADSHPEYTITIRLKENDGAASIYPTLTLTSEAAPQAMPSLVLLNRMELESAAKLGIIYPLTQMDYTQDVDWYDYAKSLSLVDNSIYGVPLAGDAMILVSRRDPSVSPAEAAANSIENLGWAELVNQSETIAFPGADPLGLFTLTLYLSAGGQLQDPELHPMVQPEILSQVYQTYEKGAASGVLSSWDANIETPGDALNYFDQYEAQRVITTVSEYYGKWMNPQEETEPLPAIHGGYYALANGWLWAIPDPDPDRRIITEQLVNFLSDPVFLTSWSLDADYLPVRPSSVVSDPGVQRKAFMGQVILSLQNIPSIDLINIIGPILRDGTVAVLKSEMNASQAANDAVQELTPEE
jgi:multiple sugar transport system substrate-binding protein